MARPTHDEIEQVSQLRREGDLGGYVRQLGGIKLKPKQEYLSVQCPHCRAAVNQWCTGLRGMRLSAGVHEARIHALTGPVRTESKTTAGAWPMGLPMKEEEEVSLTNEQAIRAMALQAAATLIASIPGDERDVVMMATNFIPFIREGFTGFPGEQPSEPDTAAMAQGFALSGYNATTRDEFGAVWRNAKDADLMSVLVTIGEDTKQELGAYLTVLSEKFRSPSREAERQGIRGELGL